MIKNILVIGSGWLGLSLAKELKKQGFTVKSTTTTPTKEIIGSGNMPTIVHFDSHNADYKKLASDAFDLIIITIPPKRTDNDYLLQLMTLHELTLTLGIKNLIFISSTSVWGECTGKVVEQTPMTPITDSAKAMVAFEEFINTQTNYQATTIKLAGLVGGTRHPGRFLAGKKNVGSPYAPVNMVVRDDVIGIVLAVITQNQWQQSFIACAPSHPTREAFYTTAAKRLGLEPATFAHVQPEITGKLIDASSTKKQLNYQYQYNDLMQWLEQ